MSHSEAELIQKRRWVGILSLLSALGGVVAWQLEGSTSAIAGPCVRIGVVLGALWLALPTKSRPAAWARIRPWHIGILIVFLILLPRLKPLLPAILIGIVIGWLLSRRRKM